MRVRLHSLSTGFVIIEVGKKRSNCGLRLSTEYRKRFSLILKASKPSNQLFPTLLSVRDAVPIRVIINDLQKEAEPEWAPRPPLKRPVKL
jgi:hypothetical protein